MAALHKQIQNLVWVQLLLLWAACASAQVRFVPQLGQWEGDFAYKTSMSQGAIFLENDGYTALLQEAEDHHHGSHSDGPAPRQVAYRMRWQGAQPEAEYIAGAASSSYHNYFLGNDQERWQSEVPLYEEVVLTNLYPGVRVRYGESEGHLKYDLLLNSPQAVKQITMRYEGLKSISLKEGRLILETALGPVEEFIPAAWQLIDGERHVVACHYRLEGQEVSFELKGTRPGYPVVIDPVLIFSSFTGSPVANWGFSATYSHDGSFYAGGISLETGYPVDSLGIQSTFGGGSCDITINKFSPDGDQMLFSTYLGGEGVDIPHSMMEDQQGNLVILGNTGSSQFPISSQAFQDSFYLGDNTKSFTFRYLKGSHLFVTRIKGDGSSLMASTYLGGSKADGLNMNIFRNYGDNNRSEVELLPNGDVAFVSSALSRDLPLDSGLAKLSDTTQTAIVGVLSANLQTLRWGHYFGGSRNETGYGLVISGQALVICGSTTSNDLPMVSGMSYQDSLAGDIDGYLAHFDLSTGQLVETSYLGTAQEDQAFLLEADKNGHLYVLGQSEGNIPISNGLYANPGSWQFLQCYNLSLTNQLWSTQLGSGKGKYDLVPTAMMVDHCFSIYLSGWNGNSNDINLSGVRGNTFDLPTTANAFQSTTDGSDFYFMVLGRDASSLLFASFFGGTAEEHCDGGTSRFSPDGVIYQAACAACRSSDFPTTPGSYSPSKPNTSCNYAAIKIDFETLVQSRPEVNFTLDVDTICDALQVSFTNNSIRANRYFWDFDNGQSSTLAEPQTIFNSFGTYTVMLIAEDTICQISDTSFIEIVHDTGISPTAVIELDFAGCDANYEARFSNATKRPTTAEWYFGDGSQSQQNDPLHQYPGQGQYQVMLVVTDIECGRRDTAFAEVIFNDTVPSPQFRVISERCSDGRVLITGEDLRQRYSYRWEYPGGIQQGPFPSIRFSSPGSYTIQLQINDSLCSRSYWQNFPIEIEELASEIYIPNAFTPNGDEINDELIIYGSTCDEQSLLRIYNRWGMLIFETETPFEEFWDGQFQGRDASGGVYVYVLSTSQGIEKGHITLVR